MINISTPSGEPVPAIGYQTENLRTLVGVSLEDMADIINEYPGGTYTLGYKREGDKCFFISENFEVDEENLLLKWTVESAAIAVKGIVEVQVSYTFEDVISDTRIYKYRVRKSIFSADQAPKTFIDLISKGLSAIDSSTRRAESAAATATEKAEEAHQTLIIVKEVAEGIEDLGLTVVENRLNVIYGTDEQEEEE